MHGDTAPSGAARSPRPDRRRPRSGGRRERAGGTGTGGGADLFAGLSWPPCTRYTLLTCLPGDGASYGTEPSLRIVSCAAHPVHPVGLPPRRGGCSAARWTSPRGACARRERATHAGSMLGGRPRRPGTPGRSPLGDPETPSAADIGWRPAPPAPTAVRPPSGTAIRRVSARGKDNRRGTAARPGGTPPATCRMLLNLSASSLKKVPRMSHVLSIMSTLRRPRRPTRPRTRTRPPRTPATHPPTHPPTHHIPCISYLRERFNPILLFLHSLGSARISVCTHTLTLKR